MHKITDLSLLFNNLPEERKYRYNFSILRSGCKNLLGILGMPEEDYFSKYFLCGVDEKNFKLTSMFRFRTAYRLFLKRDIKSFIAYNNLDSIWDLYPRKSEIQRFVMLQGFCMTVYKSPVILSKDLLKENMFDPMEFEKCVSRTIGRIRTGEKRYEQRALQDEGEIR